MKLNVNGLIAFQAQLVQNTGVEILLSCSAISKLLVVVIKTSPMLGKNIIALVLQFLEKLQSALCNLLAFVQTLTRIFVTVTTAHEVLKILIAVLPKMMCSPHQYRRGNGKLLSFQILECDVLNTGSHNKESKIY